MLFVGKGFEGQYFVAVTIIVQWMHIHRNDSFEVEISFEIGIVA
jgi:hypothetical protein